MERPAAANGKRESTEKFVLTLALILTFSPGEKEQTLSVFGFANTCPATPVAG